MEYRSDVLLDRVCSEKQILQASLDELKSRMKEASTEQTEALLRQMRRIEKNRESLEALMEQVDSVADGDVSAETVARVGRALEKLKQSINEGFCLVPK